MGRGVVLQRYPGVMCGQRQAIELHSQDTAADAAWVLDPYVVAGGVIVKHYPKARPRFWYAWVEEQGRSLQVESENPLEASAVHPSGRAGVPGPSATSDIGGRGIEVTASDVGLDLVAVNCVGRARMIYGVQDREQLASLIAVAENGECNHRPDGAMRILTAVLPDAGRICFDISGVERRLVEGWGEEQH